MQSPLSVDRSAIAMVRFGYDCERNSSSLQSRHQALKIAWLLEYRPMAEAGERRALAEARVGKPFANKFRLHRLLGMGGMAAVYEATHRNGKRIALKVMHPRFCDSERQRKRFLREAYVANSIEHPGVVPVYDDGVDDTGAAYLVMELLSGDTLAALRKRSGGKLELVAVLDIADQLLDVLAAAHERGVIHRDLKPENLFWESSGRLRVLDFGVARSFVHVPGSTVDTQASVLGTPAFMPPEQARGHWNDIDQRSDLWAVGATLFNLVSGQFVHGEGTPNEQLGRAMSVPARTLREITPELPAPFIEAVDRALRYERHERWPDARTMQHALWELRGSGPRPANERLETASKPQPSTVSWLAVVTETSSFAASLVARSKIQRLGPPLLALVLIGAMAAAARWQPTTAFAHDPDYRMRSQLKLLNIGSRVTVALHAAAQPEPTPTVSPALRTERNVSSTKREPWVEQDTRRRSASNHDRSSAPRSSRSDAAERRASISRTDSTPPNTSPAAPGPAEPQSEAAANGPAFLDSRF
jgi:serine/threonine protein kinase